MFNNEFRNGIIKCSATNHEWNKQEKATSSLNFILQSLLENLPINTREFSSKDRS